MTICALHRAPLIAPLYLPPSLASRAIDLLTHELTRRSQALSLLEEEVTAKDAETKAEQGRRAEAEREIESGFAQVGHCNARCWPPSPSRLFLFLIESVSFVSAPPSHTSFFSHSFSPALRHRLTFLEEKVSRAEICAGAAQRRCVVVEKERCGGEGKEGRGVGKERA